MKKTTYSLINFDENGVVINPRIIRSNLPGRFEKLYIDSILKHQYARRLVEGQPVPTFNVRKTFENNRLCNNCVRPSKHKLNDK
jgi:hypothetical protein